MITFYSKCEIKYDHCKLLINERLITPFQTVKPTIHIIRDGTIVDSYYESDLEPKFMLDKPYDFIIHEISNVVSKDCDTIYMTRLTSLTKESINRNVKLSNIKFVYISLNNNDEIIPIDFVPHNNYYIVGNKLFDVSFVKWYCSSKLNITLNDNYELNILDHKTNEIVINKNNYIIIGLNDYEVCSCYEDEKVENKDDEKVENKDDENDSEPQMLEKPTTTVGTGGMWWWGNNKID